jgi:hypothetical protein
MTDDRAMRIAVAAGEQVVENNPSLAAVQRAAWTRFIRYVWGGPAARSTDATKQFVGECADRMAPGDETVRA